MAKEITHSATPYLSQIVQQLQNLEPYQIILFGSQAQGTAHADSDIDLIVVLNRAGLSRTYADKVAKRKLVHQQLLELERQVPLDTLVYTKEEWRLFLSQNSAFAREVQQTGVVLYETDHARMAESRQR